MYIYIYKWNLQFSMFLNFLFGFGKRKGCPQAETVDVAGVQSIPWLAIRLSCLQHSKATDHLEIPRNTSNYLAILLGFSLLSS